jgi:hypothetical protein
MNDIHEHLRAAVKLNQDGLVLDEILAQCPDAECPECGRVICPLGDPMHFHHDGCPAEAEALGE